MNLLSFRNPVIAARSAHNAAEIVSTAFDRVKDNALLTAGGMYEGCIYAAHLIAEDVASDMRKAGLRVQKIWAWGKNYEASNEKKALSVAFRYDLDGATARTFNLHVATLISGESLNRALVIDPCFFDRPASREKWENHFLTIDPAQRAFIAPAKITITEINAHMPYLDEGKLRFVREPNFSAFARRKLLQTRINPRLDAQ